MKLINIDGQNNDKTPPPGFRRRRFLHVLRLIDDVLLTKPVCKILDVGGEEVYWKMINSVIGDRRIEVDMVNLFETETSDPRIRSLKGNACDLIGFRNAGYDIAHSNSVIEHVGDWKNMQEMARGFRECASRYFLQVPYFWFPYEPHWRVPFLHWFSDPIRAKMFKAFALNQPRSSNTDLAMHRAQASRTLDREQLAALFPDARIVDEKFLGFMTKSLMAIRG